MLTSLRELLVLFGPVIDDAERQFAEAAERRAEPFLAKGSGLMMSDEDGTRARPAGCIGSVVRFGSRGSRKRERGSVAVDGRTLLELALD